MILPEDLLIKTMNGHTKIIDNNKTNDFNKTNL